MQSAAAARPRVPNLRWGIALLLGSAPDPKRRERYHAIYARYRAAVDATLPLYARA